MCDNAIPEWVYQLDVPLDTKMGFQLHHLTPQKVVGSIPVEGNTQPFGLLHGGASAVLVESLGSMGAACYGYPHAIGVGVDLNITHLKKVRSGRVTGTATPLHLGSRIASYQVEIRNDAEELVAIGRITCQLIPHQAPDASTDTTDA